MDFDHYTAVLLVLREDAPVMSDADADALQDAHMAHLADLHDAGHLLAAGPVQHPTYRGLSVFDVPAEDAVRLLRDDPAVRAGRLEVVVLPWMVPGGAVSFPPAPFPRSMAEAG